MQTVTYPWKLGFSHLPSVSSIFCRGVNKLSCVNEITPSQTVGQRSAASKSAEILSIASRDWRRSESNQLLINRFYQLVLIDWLAADSDVIGYSWRESFVEALNGTWQEGVVEERNHACITNWLRQNNKWSSDCKLPPRLMAWVCIPLQHAV